MGAISPHLWLVFGPTMWPCGVPPFFFGLCQFQSWSLASTNALCFGVPLLLSISRFLEKVGYLWYTPEVQQFAPEVERWERKTIYFSIGVSVTFRGELLNFGRVLALVMGKKWVPTIARVDNMHRFIHEALRQSNIAIENWCFETVFFWCPPSLKVPWSF